jgi:hypothetical protein
MSYFPETVVEVTLTATQLLTLNSAPVVVVPGKTGCIVDIKSCFARYNPGSTPFNVNHASTTDIFQLYTGTTDNNFNTYQLGCAGFLDQTTSQMGWIASNWWLSDPQPLTDVEGASIYLAQYDGNQGFPAGTNWTVGNGTLTLIMRVAYIVA